MTNINWIACSDRMPAKSDNVLFVDCLSSVKAERDVHIGYFDGNMWFCRCCRDCDGENDSWPTSWVTHWCPTTLPE